VRQERKRQHKNRRTPNCEDKTTQKILVASTFFTTETRAALGHFVPFGRGGMTKI
jgi:hypothetical protein